MGHRPEECPHTVLTTPGLLVPAQRTQAHVPGSRLYRGDWPPIPAAALHNPPVDRKKGVGQHESKVAEPRVLYVVW